MASAALTRWQTMRTSALVALEAQCAVSTGPPLSDENLRGYVLLLSAHFQGFCRELYSECVQAVMRPCPAAMRFVVQRQCEAHCQLETKNPSFETVSADFGRFGLSLAAWTQPGSANQVLVTNVSLLNRWRNFAAHSNPVSPAHPAVLTGAVIAGWRAACKTFAEELDRELYNHLTAVTGSQPW